MPLRISASVVKILLGMMFLVSAVSKFVTIDTFEMYIFSFGIFSLNVSYFVARLAIAFELVLAAALISHRYHRFTVLMSLLFLLCFTVFLTYAHLIGRSDSCHCFGELMPLDPVQSILKNAVLILLLVFVLRFARHDWAPRWWLVIIVYLLSGFVLTFYMAKSLHLINLLSLVMILVTMCVGILASFKFYSRWYMIAMLVLAPIVTTFILTPPDNWLFKETDERFDQELFQSLYRENPETDTTPELQSFGIDKGRHIVAFFSPNCKYCRLAAGKLSTIIDRDNIDTSKVVYVFPIVKNKESYAKFYKESRSSHFREAFIDKELFIRITRAAFPIVVLLEDGETKASFAYRNINEEMISDFLSPQSNP